MNRLEKRMLAILEQGRADYGVVAVKAEFEAEGTRVDELLRLLEIARRAQVKVAIKIGGCEAIRDLIECRLYGVDYIIAPMVESPYALKKYIEAVNKVFPAEEREDIGFLFNVETRATYDNLLEMAQIAQADDIGMVFGRVDFAGSMGRTRDYINSNEMDIYASRVGEAARRFGLDLVIGGGVAPASIPVLRKVRAIRLDRFETRKVVFDAAMVERANAGAGMELAIEFELLWLKNKRDYYGAIAAEDAKRIDMMEQRRQNSLAAAA